MNSVDDDIECRTDFAAGSKTRRVGSGIRGVGNLGPHWREARLRNCRFLTSPAVAQVGDIVAGNWYACGHTDDRTARGIPGVNLYQIDKKTIS